MARGGQSCCVHLEANGAVLPLVKLLVSQAAMGPSAAMFAAWALSSMAAHSPRAVVP